jgi:eukaryotic-like serine/threonine-protein kinase
LGHPRLEEPFTGNDRFRVEACIGSGGMGVVYRAQDELRRAKVALKTLDQVDAAGIFQLKEEFRSIAEFSHPNVVLCHELVRVGAHWFFTMDLVEGVPFTSAAWRRSVGDVRSAATPTVAAETRLQLPLAHGSTELARAGGAYAPRSGPRTSQESRTLDAAPASVVPTLPSVRPPSPVGDFVRLRKLVGQLVDGLAALHAAGMLHCDIKPSNVLVTAADEVVILDFGIAQTVERGRRDLAEGERPRGTPTYMSPEQGLTTALTPATDSYSVGAMLYETLTGALPFEGAPMAILLAKQRVLPPRPSELVDGVPSDLDDLVMHLLAIHAEARPTSSEVAALLGFKRARWTARASDRRSRFEGRTKELAALTAALDEVRAGAPTVVHVSAPSGMGKSALLARFAELTEGPGTVVVVGRSYERESVPFKAFDTLIDALTRHLLRLPPEDVQRLLPTHAEELALVFPVLRAVHERAHPSRAASSLAAGLPPHVLQRRAFEAFAELVRRLSERETVILVMDDLHWADTDSARLLEHWVRAGLPPLLLVLGYREEPAWDRRGAPHVMQTVARLRDEDFAGARVSTLRLTELEPGEAIEAASELLRARGRLSPGFARAIAKASGGHPFFLGELVEHVDSTAELPTTRELDDLGEGPSAGASSPPRSPADRAATASASVADALRARVLALPPAARRLLEVVSVASRPLDVAVALRAAGLTEEGSHLATLRVARFVTTTGSHDGRTRILAAHERVRETVLQQLAPADSTDVGAASGAALVAIHAALAESLEAGADDADEESLAHHLIACGRAERGRSFALRAARRSIENLAFLRAADLFGEVLALDAEEAAPSLLREYADALAAGGRGAEAGRAYLRAARRLAPAASADGAGDTSGAPPAARDERNELLRLAAEHLLKSGQGEEGTEVLRETLAAVGLRFPEHTVEAVAALLTRQTRLDLSISVRIPAVSGLRARLASAASTRAAQERADATYGTSLGLSMFDVLRGAALGYLNLEEALASGDRARICRGLCLASSQAAAAGLRGRARAERLLRAAIELGPGLSDAYLQALPKLAEGNVRFFMGEWRAALGSLEEAQSLLRERCRGVFWETTTARFQAINCLIFLGELEVATRRIAPLVDEATQRSDEYALDNTTYPRVIAAIVRGAPERGRAVLASRSGRAHGGFTTGHWGAMVATITLDRYEGDGPGALAKIEEALAPMKRAMLFEVELVRVFTRYEHGLSALSTARVDRRRAADLAEKIGRALLDERPVYAAGMGRKLLGGAAATRGDRAAAREHLRLGILDLERAGLRYLAACARARRAELLDGREAEAERALSRAFFSAQRVAMPDRCVEASFPGLFS